MENIQAAVLRMMERGIEIPNGTLKNKHYKLMMALATVLDTEEFRTVDSKEMQRLTKLGRVEIEKSLKILRKHKVILFERDNETKELRFKLI